MQSKINNAAILVTGANGGLGLETVKQLLHENPTRIVLACRTESKAIKTKFIIEKSRKTEVKLEPQGGFDMNDEEAIKTAVFSLPDRQPYDIIFLQSGGVVFSDDYQFVNHNGQAD